MSELTQHLFVAKLCFIQISAGSDSDKQFTSSLDSVNYVVIELTMPTYEYECSNCNHKFEIFQSMTDSPIKKCPKCKKLQVRRLIGSGAGIIFKGSGFYATDYRRGLPQNEAKKEEVKASKSCSSCSPSSSCSTCKK